ncbi:MAG: hypothetical protein WBM69_21010 [Desulfobacterales bacterium]
MLKGRNVTLAKLTAEEQEELRLYYLKETLHAILIHAGVDGRKLAEYRFSINELKGWIFQILAKSQTEITNLTRENRKLTRQLLDTNDLLLMRFEERDVQTKDKPNN